MTVQTVGNTNSASTGGMVKVVHQLNTDFHLDFESGAMLSVQLAEATPSVMVCDKDQAMEYAD